MLRSFLCLVAFLLSIAQASGPVASFTAKVIQERNEYLDRSRTCPGKFAPKMKPLSWLLGTWESTTPGFEGTQVYEAIHGGNAIKFSFESSQQAGFEIIGWDEATGCIRTWTEQFFENELSLGTEPTVEKVKNVGSMGSVAFVSRLTGYFEIEDKHIENGDMGVARYFPDADKDSFVWSNGKIDFLNTRRT